ncbi:MAG: DUF6036 family nucleotidyltransferase [Alphaproteobacteria bacterium]|nr:DUF6036 family nucleotidyltransferase [Alphaproteobacteria bacterium]
MSTKTFNKENLDNILKELAKEYKKLVGKNMPAEIVLIGGAAVIENYGFRDMTTDIDALVSAASDMKDAINNVGERLELPRGWLNDDFKKTDSYSPKLSEVSKYYKSFYGVLNVRTVSAEYLIAMKLKSGRKYKNDLSDIVGILSEQKKNGAELGKAQIYSAIEKLYGSSDNIPKDSKSFIDNLLIGKNYDAVYEEIRSNEKDAKDILIEFEERYPDSLKTDNVDSILKTLKAKKQAEKDK